MNELKYIKDPITFLRSSGLLFEINRQVLHPFGLALAVQLPDEDDARQEEGVIQILDSREDKEGFVYDEESFIHGIEKMNSLLEEFGSAKLEERVEELGYIVQEHPDPYMKKNGVPLITYNPSFDPDSEESPDIVLFRVPYEWLDKAVQRWYQYDVIEFMDMYTYDHTEPLYAEAKEAGVIIEEHFARDVL